VAAGLIVEPVWKKSRERTSLCTQAAPPQALRPAPGTCDRVGVCTRGTISNRNINQQTDRYRPAQQLQATALAAAALDDRGHSSQRGRKHLLSIDVHQLLQAVDPSQAAQAQGEFTTVLLLAGEAGQGLCSDGL
jgi:hypothetical protein